MRGKKKHGLRVSALMLSALILMSAATFSVFAEEGGEGPLSSETSEGSESSESSEGSESSEMSEGGESSESSEGSESFETSEGEESSAPGEFSLPPADNGGIMGISEDGEENEFAAQIGDRSYATLTDAIAAVSGAGEIKLLKDITEDVVIPSGKTVALDLNGKKLTGGSTVNSRVVTVKSGANMTLMDSGTGGAIIGVAEGASTMEVEAGGTATVNSGTLETRGEWAQIPILNRGTLTLNGGATKNEPNGWNIFAPIANNGTLTITGGTFETASHSVVENTITGTLVISGGVLTTTYENGAALQNGGTATVSGGTLNGGICVHPISNSDTSTTISGGTINGDVRTQTDDDADAARPTVNITGGKITGSIYKTEYDTYTFLVKEVPADSTIAKIEISGGTFSQKPADALLAANYTLTGTDGNYTVQAVSTAAPSATAEPTASAVPTATPVPSPATGDTTSVVLPILLLLLSSGAVGGMIWFRRRRG